MSSSFALVAGSDQSPAELISSKRVSKLKATDTTIRELSGWSSGLTFAPTDSQ